MLIIAPFITALVAYLMGSINSAVILSKSFYGNDVRNYGSGNAGTTNMLRTFGIRAAVFTFAGDILKGLLAVVFGRFLFSSFGMAGQVVYGAYLAGYCAIIGHMYPLYFHFKGGKGVATGLGAVMAINPVVFGILFPIGLAIAGFSGFVSLASLSGAVLFPILVCVIRYISGGVDFIELLLALGLAALIIYNHRTNITRLLSGTENKFYKKK